MHCCQFILMMFAVGTLAAETTAIKPADKTDIRVNPMQLTASFSGQDDVSELHKFTPAVGWEPIPIGGKLTDDNPYIEMANYIVDQLYIHKVKPSESAEFWDQPAFWLAWGATAPESRFCNDPKLNEFALEELDRWTLALEKKPQGFWAGIPALQTVDFWRRSGKLSKDRIDQLLKRLQPSVEQVLKSQENKSWLSTTPNIMHQAAAELALAASIFEAAKFAPDRIDVYRNAAQKSIENAEKYSLPGGAYSYMPGTGPDVTYYNFDAIFLGIYYLTTGDKQVRNRLTAMAEWSRSVDRFGWGLSFSAPWWKHFPGRSGVFYGGEVIAGVSGDPLTASVMKIRRTWRQNHYYMYYAMLFYRNLATSEISDRCEYDRNSNGPALRIGILDVEMPFQSRNECTAGLSLGAKNPDILMSATLAPMRKELEPGIDNLGIIGSGHTQVFCDEYLKQSTLIGERWIAQAVTYCPAWGIFSLKDREGFQRTDIYFADENGLAGAIYLQCSRTPPPDDIKLFIRTRGNFEVRNNKELVSARMIINVGGDFESLKLGPPQNYELNIWEAQWKSVAKPGAIYIATIAAFPFGCDGTVESATESNGLFSVLLNRPKGEQIELCYNLGITKKITPSPGKSVWRKSAGKEYNTVRCDTAFEFESGELIILRTTKK